MDSKPTKLNLLYLLCNEDAMLKSVVKLTKTIDEWWKKLGKAKYE